jgi:ABC-type antimicrobial peptide transport system permease subunit
MALGADATAILIMMGWEVMTLGALGALLGIGVALALSHALGAFVYGISVYDPASYLLSVLVLLGIAALAGFAPTYRASRVAPATVLKSE